MNPWALLAGCVLWVASVAGSLWFGYQTGKDSELAAQAKVEKAIEDTRKIAMEGAAGEISKIVVRNTTIQGRVETVVRDNPVYRDCVHPDSTLRLLNDALTGAGRTGSPGGGKLPGTDATP